jgi:hypothetical protein
MEKQWVKKKHCGGKRKIPDFNPWYEESHFFFQ